ATGNVSLALGNNPGGGTLAGTTQVAVSNGEATFAGLSLSATGTGYTLSASFGTLPVVASSAFNITPAAPMSLVFVQQPTSAPAGASITPAVRVALNDAFGNRVTDATGNVSLALGNNPGGGTLSGTTQVAVSNGEATFSNLSLRVVGTGYTLSASFGTLSSVTSSAFDVTPGAPAALVYLQQPTAITAGSPITPAVRVAVDDAFGNRATDATGNVSLALGNNPGGGTLSGTTQVALSNGEATFEGVSVTTAGTGYTLSATFGSVPAVTSSAFNVAAPVASLAFVNAPGNVTAGVAFNPVVTVELRDAAGNRTAASATVTLRLGNNPTGASLVGTTTVAAVDGLAAFPGLLMQRAGTGYTVEAVSGSVPVLTSGAFNVSPAAFDHLSVATQPLETVVAGESVGSIRVEARDAFENLVPSFTPALRAGVDYDLNPNGASVVAGTRQVTPVGGVATFTGLALDKVGATQIVFVSNTSPFFLVYTRPINVIPAAAAALAFQRVPQQAQAGSALGPAVQVAVTDRFGNPTSGSGDVTLSLAANPGGDTLRGTLTATVTNGVATFADLVLQKAAQGYTLKASRTGMTPVTSNPFTVVGAEPTRVAFTVHPRSTPNGLPLNEVAVHLVDAFGNTAASNASVTLALGNANGAVLGGTVTVAAVDGVARFADLTVDQRGEDYTLEASSGSLTGAGSNAFDVYGASLAYTDPAAGRIRVMRNAASTDSRLVLDVVAAEELSGYGVGFNLPLDATKVRLAAQNAITAGAILSTGSTVPAVAAALPTSGPMAGVLTSGISQKAAGSGAVQTDTTITAGSVLYQLVLELAPGAEPGVVFDGATLGSGFKGLLRNKVGDDVVGSSGFTVGRLEIAADPAGFQKTASR
ncbi:beta strand repeat-containing protein, partial [Pyxidicoccus sp. 3LG]